MQASQFGQFCCTLQSEEGRLNPRTGGERGGCGVEVRGVGRLLVQAAKAAQASTPGQGLICNTHFTSQFCDNPKGLMEKGGQVE
jgi:hypothetical protein